MHKHKQEKRKDPMRQGKGYLKEQYLIHIYYDFFYSQTANNFLM